MYVFAKLGKFEFLVTRFLGSGLGNILFPWARSVIAAERYGLRCIEPTWLNLRVGSIIRMEKDLRFYSDLFVLNNNNISGLKKIFLLLVSRHVPEQDISLTNGKSVVIFSGIDGYFYPILDDYKFIREQLIRITNPKYLTGMSYDFGDSISVHVRLGDFKVGMQTTPLTWFINVANLVRQKFKSRMAIYIFSDGSDSELAPLLEVNDSRRISFGSSIADLLALSQSNILIGSKGSTFSMWASYLGRMPVIWPVGGLVNRLYTDDYSQEVESDGYSIPLTFAQDQQVSPSENSVPSKVYRGAGIRA